MFEILNNACIRYVRGQVLLHTHPASELEEDAERREDDGEDDVDAGRRAVRHLLLLSLACSKLRGGGREKYYQRPGTGRQRASERGVCDELL
jgi:hypothetical protein